MISGENTDLFSKLKAALIYFSFPLLYVDFVNTKDAKLALEFERVCSD